MGDNVKFTFQMDFSTIMLAQSMLEFGDLMGSEIENVFAVIHWASDYFLKAITLTQENCSCRYDQLKTIIYCTKQQFLKS